jgi:hypothetical protein
LVSTFSGEVQFAYHDPRTGKRRRTTYRLTLAEARARYIDPQPVDGSREVQADGPGYGATLGAGTTVLPENP